jgi:putative SbcD/Mre11-related phosphoesterase
MAVEPIPGKPAAVATTDGERLLVVADVHAGIEAGLRRDGVELPSRADERRDQLIGLIDDSSPDQLVVLGDFGHAIGDAERTEREELRELLRTLSDRVPVTITKGNHDGAIEGVVSDSDGVRLSPGHGVRLGSVGFAHGHTYPSPDVLSADILCIGHEHPVVRLEDEVGGDRRERSWLRGGVDPGPFHAFHGEVPVPDELVVFPAFNDLSGGTWVNVDGQDFLAPFLPEALLDGQTYLLDGTRLGNYQNI